MKSKMVSARRTIDLPWHDGLATGLYNLATGRLAPGGYYSKSAFAHACMNIRGTELANLPWQITRNGEIVDNHPLVDMLIKFGPESNYAEAMIATEIDMLRIGAAYWLRDVDMLKRLNPATIDAVKTRDGISGFEQTIDGKIVNRFKREEIVYFREYHPADDLGTGVAVMDVIKKAVDTEYEALLYIEAFWKNDTELHQQAADMIGSGRTLLNDQFT